MRLWRASDGGQAADALELDHLALLQLGEAFLLGIELALALLEARPRGVRATRPCGPAPRHDRAAVAPARWRSAALLARLLLGGTLRLQRVVLPLEDDLLLLGARVGHQPLGVALGVLDAAGRQEAARQVSDGDSRDQCGGDRRHDDSVVRHRLLRWLEPVWAMIAPLRRGFNGRLVRRPDHSMAPRTRRWRSVAQPAADHPRGVRPRRCAPAR